MPKQCPLKMAAAMTQSNIADMHKLQGGDYGYSLCTEVECAWWIYNQCAVVLIAGELPNISGELNKNTPFL